MTITISKTETLKLKFGDNYVEFSADQTDASIFILVQDKKKIYSEIINNFEDYAKFMTYGRMETFLFWKNCIANKFSLNNDTIKEFFNIKNVKGIEKKCKI